MSKARRADAHPVRDVQTVGNHEIAVFPFGSLGRAVVLAPRRGYASGGIDKMMNQRLDVLQGVFFLRQDIAVVVGYPAAFRHVFEALGDNPEGLPDLLHPHLIAGPAVAAFGYGDLEVEAVVAAVNHLLAQIPGKAAGAQVGAAHSPFHGIVKADRADALEAGFEYRVVLEKIVVLLHAAGHPGQEITHRLFPADTEPGGMHPAAGDHLDDVEDLLPVGKHIEDRRHGAHIGGIGAVPDEVAGDAEQFGQHDPDHNCPIRYLDIAEPFDGGQIGQIILDACQVIDPIGIGDKLVPVLPFADLFGRAVVIADVGIHIDDLFAFQLQYKADDAVGTGVLGAQIQDQGFVVDPLEIFDGGQRLVAARVLYGVGGHFGCLEGMLFP